MQENEFSNQLDWLAFCYIADELNEEQRNAFELRLAEDQQVRDAVVQAMEQSQLLFAALADVDVVTKIPGSAEVHTGFPHNWPANCWRLRQLCF